MSVTSLGSRLPVGGSTSGGNVIPDLPRQHRSGGIALRVLAAGIGRHHVDPLHPLAIDRDVGDGESSRRSSCIRKARTASIAPALLVPRFPPADTIEYRSISIIDRPISSVVENIKFY
jgi:hypothetical protein